MTEKLYEIDAYCREFKATVLSCTSKNSGEGEFYEIVLDKTAFFPEGGGQAADVGYIDDAEVVDVQIAGDQIVHRAGSAVPVGVEVDCKIDWALRFERMQSHSGEHVFSGVVHSLFGYDNVGFHMSETSMTVDCNGPLSANDIEKIELAVNEALYRNVDITASFPTAAELAQIEYRSKIDFTEGVRLVTIDGVDCCACCAPHVARTGEIGLVKVINFLPYKGGTRVEMVAGVNALKDYMALNNSNRQMMGVLSAPRDGVVAAVEKQGEQLNCLRAEVKNLAKRVALAELEPVEIGESAYAMLSGVEFDELRLCANVMMERGAKICVLLSRKGEANDAGDVGKCTDAGCACSAGDYLYVISSQSEDVRGLVKKLNTAFNGKGGGKPEYAQGKLVVDSEVELKVFIEGLLM